MQTQPHTININVYMLLYEYEWIMIWRPVGIGNAQCIFVICRTQTTAKNEISVLRETFSVFDHVHKMFQTYCNEWNCRKAHNHFQWLQCIQGRYKNNPSRCFKAVTKKITFTSRPAARRRTGEPELESSPWHWHCQ